VDLFSLAGKRAVVTGASRGIGLAMAVALADAGAAITAVSSSPLTPDTPLPAAFAGRPLNHHAADFADRQAVRELARALRAEGDVDILVNNAGTIHRAPAAAHDDADFDHVLAVNLAAQFTLTRELGADMVARGSGKIIFTASVLSFQGGINVIGYTAAKSALAGVTRAFATEWAASGVNVNAIAPGYIRTDNTRALQDDPVRDQAILDRIPAGRWGEPADLAGAAVFLASRASDYVHGAILPVDGGWLAR
jgi:2-dehydro-3-deoxy-D-gluconate 5-dehydrogenase